VSVRTGFAGTTSVGDVLTSANITSLPGGWLGSVTVVASQTGITTVTDLTSLSLTVTAGTSRRLRIWAQGILTRTVADGLTLLSIKEGATVLMQLQAAPSNVNGDTITGFVDVLPSSGSHTYKLTLERASGTGTVGLAASSTSPAYILAEDIGPAS
jgi:hypothetical protein